MKNSIVFLFLAVSVYPLLTSDQKSIDFSGEWLLSKEKSHFQLKILDSLEKGVVYIDHKEPVFRFRRIFTSKGQDDSLTYELTTDGKEVTTQEGDQTYVSRSASAV